MASLEEHLFKKSSRYYLWAILALLILVLVFLAGVSVGRRSVFHGRGEFHPSFAPEGFMLPGSYISHGHGAVGTVTSIALPALTIAEPDGDTERVMVASTTIIEGPAGTSSLQIGSHIIVLGTPNEANEEIQAKLIRIAR